MAEAQRELQRRLTRQTQRLELAVQHAVSNDPSGLADAQFFAQLLASEQQQGADQKAHPPGERTQLMQQQQQQLPAGSVVLGDVTFGSNESRWQAQGSQQGDGRQLEPPLQQQDGGLGGAGPTARQTGIEADGEQQGAGSRTARGAASGASDVGLGAPTPYSTPVKGAPPASPRLAQTSPRVQRRGLLGWLFGQKQPVAVHAGGGNG